MRCIGWKSFLTTLLVCGLLQPRGTQAQTKAPKPNGSGGGTEESGGLGFSIESEMLTYTALERCSEAVAKDLVPLLNGNHEGAVVILPSNSKVLANFELWRADMAVLYSLVERAADLEKQSASATPATKASALDFTLPDKALSLAQKLLATSESTSSLRGTASDQAFVDSLARQLQLLGVSVLMPDTHMPYSLASGNDHHFLLLRKLEEVDDIRYKLLGADKSKWSATKIADARLLLADIEAFRATVFGGQAGAVPPSDGQKEADRSSAVGNETQGKTAPLTTLPSSGFSSLLSVDLLAQELDIDPSGTNLLPTGHWQHVLWLKALESGGSVTRTENFLRTRIQYSGGAIGTYAMFSLKGELECSGNVYAYGGPLRGKDFRKRRPETAFDPILQGGCKAAQNLPPSK